MGLLDELIRNENFPVFSKSVHLQLRPYYLIHKTSSADLETITQCPVCGKSEFKPFLSCTDYLVSNKEFTIQVCLTCGFRFTNPRPDASSIGSYYKSEEYVSHNDESSGLINAAYRLVRNFTLRSKLKLINRLTNGEGRVLDVGCGTGAFLENCKAGGWEVMGMEPDEDARSIAQKKLQIEIKPNLSALTTIETFDIITLWHVLEHIPALHQTIAQLHQLLAPTGTLLIAVPNSDSYDAGYFNQYWAAYDVPRHLNHFTPSTIKPLFEAYGFQLIDTLPMIFDAFYISMLSTRYQTGKTDYLKSVRIGMLSNTKARKTGNSSSLMYLFRRAQ